MTKQYVRPNPGYRYLKEGFYKLLERVNDKMYRIEPGTFYQECFDGNLYAKLEVVRRFAGAPFFEKGDIVYGYEKRYDAYGNEISELIVFDDRMEEFVTVPPSYFEPYKEKVEPVAEVKEDESSDLISDIALDTGLSEDQVVEFASLYAKVMMTELKSEDDSVATAIIKNLVNILKREIKNYKDQ